MKVAIGQDSHCIDIENTKKELKLGGVQFEEPYSLKANSDGDVVHVSISIECQRPKISPKIEEMRKNIARILKIQENCVGITATTGEGLTEFGRENGICVFACITVE